MLLFWGSRETVNTLFDSRAFSDASMFDQTFEPITDDRVGCVYFFMFRGSLVRIGKAKILAQRLDMYYGERVCSVDAIAILEEKKEVNRFGFETFFIRHFSPPFNFACGTRAKKPEFPVKLKYANLDRPLFRHEVRSFKLPSLGKTFSLPK